MLIIIQSLDSQNISIRIVSERFLWNLVLTKKIIRKNSSQLQEQEQESLEKHEKIYNCTNIFITIETDINLEIEIDIPVTQVEMELNFH